MNELQLRQVIEQWESDRSIEIQSPGGLYGDVNTANFPNQTSYRNSVISEAMFALKYVNRYGYGVIRAKEALERNGNPPPEFHFDSRFVKVTIRAKQLSPVRSNKS